MLYLTLLLLASLTVAQEYPDVTMLDQSLYEPAPAGLTLEQVHVYVRHGEHNWCGLRAPY